MATLQLPEIPSPARDNAHALLLRKHTRGYEYVTGLSMMTYPDAWRLLQSLYVFEFPYNQDVAILKGKRV
jgi:hypothetical protein